MHCPEYLSAFQSGELSESALRRIGLPWSEVRMIFDLTIDSKTRTLTPLHCHFSQSLHGSAHMGRCWWSARWRRCQARC